MVCLVWGAACGTFVREKRVVAVSEGSGGTDRVQVFDECCPLVFVFLYNHAVCCPIDRIGRVRGP